MKLRPAVPVIPGHPQPDEAPQPRPASDLIHFVCCDEDVAICGADLSECDDLFFDPPEEDSCEVCVNKKRIYAPCTIADCPMGEGPAW